MRSLTTTSASRNEMSEKRKKEEQQKKEEADLVRSLADLRCHIENDQCQKDQLLPQLKLIMNNNYVLFCKIDVGVVDLILVIKYSLNVDNNLRFQCYHHEQRVPCSQFTEIAKECKIKYFSQGVRILKHLDIIKGEKIKDEVNFHVEKLKQFECPDDVTSSKLNFLVEQIELAFMHSQHLRYSPTLLSMCVLWENTSSNLYQQIRDKGVLTTISTIYQKVDVGIKCRYRVNRPDFEIPEISSRKVKR